jgi:hypothetical protein
LGILVRYYIKVGQVLVLDMPDLREHLYCLVRRGRAIRENIKIIENLLWMKLVVYNYATYHRSLTCKDIKKKNTPAMKAGITNTKIKVEDALYFNTVSKKKWRF